MNAFGDNAVCMVLPVLVKSHMDGNRRVVEVEASNETVDSQGDVVLQSALLGSAKSFIAEGVLDIDHLSEFGRRMGIPDPASYIVGRPTEVRDAGGGKTNVIGEISKSLDGSSDPTRRRYDEFWETMQCTPPVPWRASIYGYIKDYHDVKKAGKHTSIKGATRHIIQVFDWRSLAFTRRPINDAITGTARIVTAKSWAAEVAKSMDPYGGFLPGSGMEGLNARRACPLCKVHTRPSMGAYRQHFRTCEGMMPPDAAVSAYALMHMINRERMSMNGKSAFLP